MSSPWDHNEIFTTRSIPYKLITLSTIVFYAKNEFLFLIKDAIAEVDFVFYATRKVLKYNIFVKAFTLDHEFGHLERIEQCLVGYLQVSGKFFVKIGEKN